MSCIVIFTNLGAYLADILNYSSICFMTFDRHVFIYVQFMNIFFEVLPIDSFLSRGVGGIQSWNI